MWLNVGWLLDCLWGVNMGCEFVCPVMCIEEQHTSKNLIVPSMGMTVKCFDHIGYNIKYLMKTGIQCYFADWLLTVLLTVCLDWNDTLSAPCHTFKVHICEPTSKHSIFTVFTSSIISTIVIENVILASLPKNPACPDQIKVKSQAKLVKLVDHLS